MKTNSDAPKTLYLGIDVHKAETVIAILESHRESSLGTSDPSPPLNTPSNAPCNLPCA